MIYRATRLIQKEFKKNGLTCDIYEYGSFSAVQVGFAEDDASVEMHFISRDDDNDVMLWTEEIINIPEEKMPAGYELANSLNYDYNYLKFVIVPETGGLRMQYDFPQYLEDAQVGLVAMEMMAHIFQITKEVYPRLMEFVEN